MNRRGRPPVDHCLFVQIHDRVNVSREYSIDSSIELGRGTTRRAKEHRSFLSHPIESQPCLPHRGHEFANLLVSGNSGKWCELLPDCVALMKIEFSHITPGLRRARILRP